MKCYSQNCKFVFREADKLNEASSDNELHTNIKPTNVKTRKRAKSIATNKFQNESNTHKRNISVSGGNYNTISRIHS